MKKKSMHQEAQHLNTILKKKDPALFAMLSQKGRVLFFSRQGVMQQTEDAKNARINATIGIATERRGVPMSLPQVSRRVVLSPAETVAYAPSFGDPRLRAAWFSHIKTSYKDTMSLPVVTAGLTHALSVAGLLFVDPYDMIIVPDLRWENYDLLFGVTLSADIQKWRLFSGDGLDLASFAATVKKRKGKKIVILNFPHNPSGYTPTPAEAKEMVAILKRDAARGNRITVIIDDAYCGFVYEKSAFQESLFSLLANAHKNILAIKIDGASKELYAWGLRIGFLTYGMRGISQASLKILEEKTAGAIRATVSNVSRLSQSLTLSAIQSKTLRSEQDKNFKKLSNRYQEAKKILNRHPYKKHLTVLPFNSGYFICIDLKSAAAADHLRQTLLKKYSIGVITFGKYIRISFSSLQETELKKVISIIMDEVILFL